jgi:hypothetical protein
VARQELCLIATCGKCRREIQSDLGKQRPRKSKVARNRKLGGGGGHSELRNSCVEDAEPKRLIRGGDAAQGDLCAVKFKGRKRKGPPGLRRRSRRKGVKASGGEWSLVLLQVAVGAGEI